MSIASHVMMIRPNFVGQEDELELDIGNANTPTLPISLWQEALSELDLLQNQLRDSGIQVSVFQPSEGPIPLASAFSINWVSFHPQGDIIRYPIRTHSSKLKNQAEIIQEFLDRNAAWEFTDLREYRSVGVYLEGMGSVVLDRKGRIAYACESPNTHPGFFERYCQYFEWKPIIFRANPLYKDSFAYTSSLLSVGEGFCILCKEAIAEENRKEVLDTLAVADKELIECNFDQMQQSACNLIQLQNTKGDRYIVLSEKAFQALYPSQVSRLESFGTLLPISLEVIGNLGVGGLCCILTEVFEPHS
ncbi:MAG: arginine deiminase-related protein [Bacteroidota bacterium]